MTRSEQKQIVQGVHSKADKDDAEDEDGLGGFGEANADDFCCLSRKLNVHRPPFLFQLQASGSPVRFIFVY